MTLRFYFYFKRNFFLAKSWSHAKLRSSLTTKWLPSVVLTFSRQGLREYIFRLLKSRFVQKNRSFFIVLAFLGNLYSFCFYLGCGTQWAKTRKSIRFVLNEKINIFLKILSGFWRRNQQSDENFHKTRIKSVEVIPFRCLQ